MPVRFDRFLTLCLQRALPRIEARLPILMYHSISDDVEAGVHPYYRVATSPERFAQQMQWLSELGYKGMSLEEALRTMTGGRTEGRRPVAITFDDGFRDFFSAAWPILRRHDFTATMYLPTGFIGGPRQCFCGRECLTWGEVRELRAQGVRFGSHTAGHRKLYELLWDEIEGELAVSKERLERELEESVGGFAYPYAFPQEDGAFTAALSGLLRRRGYQTCVTTVVGRVRPDDDPLQLKRLPVNACDDRALLAAKLHGAYDWIGAVQQARRQWKRWTAGARDCASAAGASGRRLVAPGGHTLS